MKTALVMRRQRSVLALTLLLLSAEGPLALGSPEQPARTGARPGGDTLEVFLVAGDEIAPVNRAFLETHPGVRLRYDSAGSQQYEMILETMLAAGDPPDVMSVWPGARTAALAREGHLLDLTDTHAVSRIEPAYSQTFAYEGRIYAVCIETGAEGLYFNGSLLSDRGLDEPRNWDELLAVSNKLARAGVQPFAAGFREDWTIQRYTNAAFATLGYGMDPDFDRKLATGRADFSFEGWVETFDKLRVLAERGFFGRFPLSTDNRQAMGAFTDGTAAMYVMPSDLVGDLRRSTGPVFDLRFTALPFNRRDEQLYGCWKTMDGLAVSRQSTSVVPALAYLDTLVEPSVHAQYIAHTGSPPVVRDMVVPLDRALAAYVARFVEPGLTRPGAHYLWPAGMSNRCTVTSPHDPARSQPSSSTQPR